MKVLIYHKIHDQKLLVLRADNLPLAKMALVLDIYIEANGTWGGGSTILGSIRDLIAGDEADERKIKTLEKKLARTDLPVSVMKGLKDDLRFLNSDSCGLSDKYRSYRRKVWEDLKKTSDRDEEAATRLIKTEKISWENREFPEGSRFVIRRPKLHFEDKKEILYPSETEEPSAELWLKIFQGRPPWDTFEPIGNIKVMESELSELEAFSNDADPVVASESGRLLGARKRMIVYETKKASRAKIRKAAENGDAAAAKEYMILSNEFNGGAKEYRADPVLDPKDVYENRVKFIRQYGNASFSLR